MPDPTPTPEYPWMMDPGFTLEPGEPIPTAVAMTAPWGASSLLLYVLLAVAIGTALIKRAKETL